MPLPNQRSGNQARRIRSRDRCLPGADDGPRRHSILSRPGEHAARLGRRARRPYRLSACHTTASRAGRHATDRARRGSGGAPPTEAVAASARSRSEPARESAIRAARRVTLDPVTSGPAIVSPARVASSAAARRRPPVYQHTFVCRSHAPIGKARVPMDIGETAKPIGTVWVFPCSIVQTQITSRPH